MSQCSVSSLSQIFSTVSLLSWICAQLPQIISNYKAKSADGISPSFLLLWFMGDFLSFSSCLLNDAALNFQIYLSLFFLANDLTLCYQYYYYNSVYPRQHFQSLSGASTGQKIVETHDAECYDTPGDLHIRPGKPGKDSPEYYVPSEPSKTTKESFPTPSSSLSSSEHGPSSPSGFGATGTSPKWGKMAAAAGVLVNAGLTHASALEPAQNTQISHFKETLGLMLAWGCTFVYVSSRCPQLYKNYLRKSVDGISPLLFGSALLGNLAYTISVLTSCDFVASDDRMHFFWKQLPYLLGSSGTIVFDVAYFYQRYIYREAGRDSTEMGLENWAE